MLAKRLVFSDVFLDIMSKHISHKIITCNDKDAPRITPQVKTAIKRNSRGFTESGSIGEETLLIKAMFGKFRTIPINL